MGDTEEILKERFNEAVKPLMKYMAENHQPHTMVVVDSNTAQLYESKRVFQSDEFLVD